MKKLPIIAAVALLMGSSAVSFAAGRGASGMAPGTQMNNSTTSSTRGASEFSPGDRMNDARRTTTGMAHPPKRGASEFSPGDRKNDLRK